jgi:hypothetical protein
MIGEGSEMLTWAFWAAVIAAAVRTSSDVFEDHIEDLDDAQDG